MPGLLQDSTLQNNYSVQLAIWLSSRLHYLSKELHYLTKGLRYHNKVNLKGTLLDMNHITTLRIQSMNIINVEVGFNVITEVNFCCINQCMDISSVILLIVGLR